MDPIIRTILIVILILLLLGALPAWGFYSGGWGAPGGLGLVLLIVLILLLVGKI